MTNNITVTVETVSQAVVIADTPTAIVVSLAGQASITLPIAGPFVAVFSNVVDGTYAGEVQSVRADGSLIGTPITFSVVAAADVVQALVPTGVSVVVTAA